MTFDVWLCDVLFIAAALTLQHFGVISGVELWVPKWLTNSVSDLQGEMQHD
jgi:hypothetical protein